MTNLKTTEIKPTIFNIYIKGSDLGEIKGKKQFVKIETTLEEDHIQETIILVPSKFIHQSKNDVEKFSVGIVPTFDYKILDTKLQVNGQDLINWYLQK